MGRQVNPLPNGAPYDKIKPMKKFKAIIEVFLLFFKIGLFTFGGGYAMISVIETEFVKKRGYLTDEELMELITVAESTPGPLAINSATYVGFKRGGVLGAALATLGVALPSFIIIFALSLFLEKFMQIAWIERAFRGVKSGVGAIIIAVGVSFCGKIHKKFLPIACFIVALGLTIAFDFLSINFSAIWFILAGGAIGLLTAKFNKQKGNSGKNTPDMIEDGDLQNRKELLNGGKDE